MKTKQKLLGNSSLTRKLDSISPKSSDSHNLIQVEVTSPLHQERLMTLFSTFISIISISAKLKTLPMKECRLFLHCSIMFFITRSRISLVTRNHSNCLSKSYFDTRYNALLCRWLSSLLIM